MASPYGGGVEVARLDVATAATSTKLVTGVTGTRIGVIAVYASSEVAGQITIEDAGDAFELYVAIDGATSMVAPTGEYLFHIAAGVDLDVTTDITGKHYVHILWKQVPA